MIGVVLAGGRSTRLGQDKVRLRLPGDGRDMLARTADLLAACTDGVVISCRAPDAGEETLALPGIRSIPDAKPGLGPLGGVWSALRELRQPILVLSCDLPFMDVPTLRRLIDAATEIASAAYEDTQPVENIMDAAEQKILAVAGAQASNGFESLKSIIMRTFEHINVLYESKGGITGLPTGFKDLDRLTSGLQASDLILVAARPSMGKTAFTLNIASYVGLHGGKVAFFSLEMPAHQLMMRLVVAETGIPGNDLKLGRLSPEQWRHLESATKPLGSAKLFIDDTPALSVFEFRSKARRLKIHSDIKIIMIDYLQLMTGGPQAAKGGNREQEVSFISRTLKAIAKELNVPIIALSQLNRSTELRGGSKRPQLSDLRESGAIEQDADIVAFIHRPEYYGINQDENGMPTAGMAELIIAKHRNGAVTDVKLRFLKDQARFADIDDADLLPGGAPAPGQQYDDFASDSNAPAGFAPGPASMVSTEFDITPRPLGDEAPF